MKQLKQNFFSKQVIAVGAGKGGVGKSTLAVNLAVALAQEGVKVALLDADIYGPSIPLMLGLRNLSPQVTQEGGLLPLTKFGMQIMSVGFFLEEAQSLLMRGPMIHGVLSKLINQVEWGECDCLIIDLPPGTGDVPITLHQLLPIDGVLMVTTPQQVAIVDVVKAMNSFQQLRVPILGIVENMSGNLADWDLFGQGRAAELAERFQTHFLGAIPLLNEIALSGDEGRPLALYRGKEMVGDLFCAIALNLLELITCKL